MRSPPDPPRQRHPGVTPHPPELGQRGHRRAARGRRRGHHRPGSTPRPARPPATRRPAPTLQPRSRLGHHHQPPPRLGQRPPPRIQPRQTPPRQSRTGLVIHPEPRRALDQQRQRPGPQSCRAIHWTSINRRPVGRKHTAFFRWQG